MFVNKCVSKVEQEAIETGQIDLESLGAAANNRAFLSNHYDGVHYNTFVDIWKWASRYFKGKHGDTHREC
jgi:hypothetical protein